MKINFRRSKVLSEKCFEECGKSDECNIFTRAFCGDTQKRIRLLLKETFEIVNVDYYLVCSFHATRTKRKRINKRVIIILSSLNSGRGRVAFGLFHIARPCSYAYSKTCDDVLKHYNFTAIFD